MFNGPISINTHPCSTESFLESDVKSSNFTIVNIVVGDIKILDKATLT